MGSSSSVPFSSSTVSAPRPTPPTAFLLSAPPSKKQSTSSLTSSSLASPNAVSLPSAQQSLGTTPVTMTPFGPAPTMAVSPSAASFSTSPSVGNAAPSGFANSNTNPFLENVGDDDIDLEFESLATSRNNRKN